MKRLYLHIGSHKTGSTSLQSFLSNNIGVLLRKNYFYPLPKSKRNYDLQHKLIHILNPRFTKEVLSGNPISLDSLPYPIADVVAASQDNSILSSENLSMVRRSEPLKTLKSLLERYFDDIRIVYFLRRQDALAVSHHQEGLKGGRFAHGHYGVSKDFFSTALGQGWDYLDHHARYQNWAGVFGEEQVQLQIFEKGRFEDGSLLKQCCRLLGVEWQHDFAPPSETNLSLGAIAQYFLEAIESGLPLLDDDKRSLRNEVTKLTLAWDRQQPDNFEKLLPTRGAAEEFYDAYRDSNELLRKARFPEQATLFDESFEAYPEHDTRQNYSLEDCRELLNFVLANLTYGAKKAG